MTAEPVEETAPGDRPEPGLEEGPAESSAESPLDYEQFGGIFLREVLHTERVLRSIDRILGEEFALGPMGAGPGRKIATLTAAGTFQPCTGEMLANEDDGLVRFRVMLPVEVDFHLDLRVDMHRFHAKVEVPLEITLRLVEPLTIVWDIVPPGEQDVVIDIRGNSRRSGVLQKLAGMDGELRRFLIRFVHRELEKPHVLKARRIPLIEVIDGAWPEIAAQFLPNGPEDRS